MGFTTNETAESTTSIPGKTDAEPTPAARPCEPSLDDLIDYLTANTDRGHDDIHQEITELQDQYQFLTPVAAAYMVGQAAGLQPSEAFETAQRDFSLDIATLQPELNNVDLTAEIATITAVNTFDRDDGSMGKVCNVILQDDTGRAVLTLWDDATAVIDELESGDTVRVESGYTKVASDYCQNRLGCDIEVRLGDDGTLLRKRGEGLWTTLNDSE